MNKRLGGRLGAGEDVLVPKLAVGHVYSVQQKLVHLERDLVPIGGGQGIVRALDGKLASTLQSAADGAQRAVGGIQPAFSRIEILLELIIQAHALVKQDHLRSIE